MQLLDLSQKGLPASSRPTAAAGSCIYNGGAWPERFRLVSGADDLETYQFGTLTARHQFCRHCGISSFYRPRADPRKFMINVRCVDGVDIDRVSIENFDGSSWELRPDAPYTGIWKDGNA